MEYLHILAAKFGKCEVCGKTPGSKACQNSPLHR